MAPLDLKATKSVRKRQLAELVAERLIALGHEAHVMTDHLNASGHRDQVIVQSSLGLVHTTASKSTDPNDAILVSDIEDASQLFLEGKAWVAYGWVDRSGRTLVQFVRAEHVMGRRSMLKTEVTRLADPHLSTVLVRASD
jgi:hypothetical protein